MGLRNSMLSRDVAGICVQQVQFDGYLNATALAKAYEQVTGTRKDVRNWLSTDRARTYIELLSAKTGIPVLELVRIKKGGNAPGTWIHPKLGIPFATWLSVEFEMLVSDWVDEWMSLYSPSQIEADTDRVNMRDELKDKKRLELTGQVKAFLVRAGNYNPKSKETGIFFGRVHNEVNLVLTGEKASAMRARLELILGRKVSDSELLRDYFPMINLANYAALCQAAANNMATGMYPIDAVRLAAKQVLPLDYVPTPIDFTERIGLVRRRLEQHGQLLLKGA